MLLGLYVLGIYVRQAFVLLRYSYFYTYLDCCIVSNTKLTYL
jgi:hypothetical protein